MRKRYSVRHNSKFAIAILSMTLLNVSNASEFGRDRAMLERHGDWISYTYADLTSPGIAPSEFWASNESSNNNTSLTLYYDEYRNCYPSISIKIENVNIDAQSNTYADSKNTSLIIDGKTQISVESESRYQAGSKSILISISGNSRDIHQGMTRGNTATLKITGGIFDGTIEPSFSLKGYTAASQRALKQCETAKYGAPASASEIQL